MARYKFYKERPKDVIWWVDNPDQKGVWLFSFDKSNVFNMFQDYPHKLTKEQKEIFDKENPCWADFFKDEEGTKPRTKHIETVFDPVHNITEDEKRRILLYDNEEKYKSSYFYLESIANRDLACLYATRGNWNKANEYLKRIPDLTERLGCLQWIFGFVND